MTNYRLDEVEGLITMSRGEYTAEVGISCRCFSKEHSSVIAVNQFRTEDRLQAILSCHVEKANRSIQAVGVCEGERVLALCLYGLTERLQCGDALHRGIGRMGM